MYEQTAQDCLAALEPLISYQAAAFYRVTPSYEPHDYVLRRMRPEMHVAYEQHYQSLDPLLPARVAPTHEVVVLEQGAVPSPKVLQDYREQFLAPFEMVDVVEMFIRHHGQVCFGLSLLRDHRLGRFAGDELALLARLMPMLGVVSRPLLLTSEKTIYTALTPREQAVAELVAEGASNKVVARTLQMSLSTVKTHLQHVFEKLGVNNRTQLAAKLLPDVHH